MGAAMSASMLCASLRCRAANSASRDALTGGGRSAKWAAEDRTEMRSLGMGSKRLAATLAGALMALGLIVGAAQSQRFAGSTSIELMTDRPGVLEISPAETEETAGCKVDAQQYVDADTGEQTLDPTPCVHHLDPGTKCHAHCRAGRGAHVRRLERLRLLEQVEAVHAEARPGHAVRCRAVQPCDAHALHDRRVRGGLREPEAAQEPAPQHLGALRVQVGHEDHVEPRARGGRANSGSARATGTTAASLDDDTCTLKLHGQRSRRCGLRERRRDPAAARLRDRGRGRGPRQGDRQRDQPRREAELRTQCTVTGLTRYDQVQLKAVTTSSAYKFSRWSNGSPLKTQTIPVSSTNRLQAMFDKK